MSLRVERRWLLRAVLVLLSGCASSSVRPLAEGRPGSMLRPTRVLVYNLAFTAADVVENQGFLAEVAKSASDETQGEREREIGRDAANAFAAELVDGINQLGLPAERANRGTVVPPNALLIGGEFLNVDEGNRTRRLVVGLGAGASRVDAQVEVYQTTQNERFKLLAFTTHGNSGKMPGAGVTMGAGAAAQGGVTAGMAVANAAVSGVKAYRTETEQMAARGGQEATAYLSEYFAKQGWISPSKVKRATKE